MEGEEEVSPYKSKAQERWVHTPTGEKALGGPSKVAEWDKASKGARLPNHAPKPRRSQGKGKR